MADQRRLQAIMFTDIQGYSARMSADEATTVRIVREHRVVVREALARHGGQEIRTIGDAFLILFASAVEATRCAIAIQEQLLERNRDLPEAEQVWVRIGLHAGEVLVGAEGELYGDAVNVAARVEPLAPTGGVCLTEQVAVQLGNLVARKPEPLGRVPLKNIPDPPNLFRIVVRPLPAPPRRPWPWRQAALALLVALASLGVGLGVHALTVEPPREWPLASEHPEVQARFEEALEAYARMDERADALSRLVVEQDPESVLGWLLRHLAAPTPGDQALALERAVKLSSGRDDAPARLARLVDDAVREHGEQIGMHLASDRGAALDAWVAENPDDVFGAYLAAHFYPVHGTETEFHAVDPRRTHLDLVRLRAFVEEHPRWAVARLRVADSFGPTRWRESQAYIEEGLVSCPECSIYHLYLAHTEILFGSLASAHDHVTAAMRLDPGSISARVALARVALRREGPDAAAPLFEDLVTPEQPAVFRAGILGGWAQELMLLGRVNEALALGPRIRAAMAEAGDHDGVARSLESEARALIDLGEVERAAEALRHVEPALASPEVSDLTRNLVGVALLADQLDLAWFDGDADRLRALAARVAALPPERAEGVDRQPILADAETKAASLAGDVAALDRLISNLHFCHNHRMAAMLYERAGAPERARERWLQVADPQVCAVEVHWRNQAHVRLAELALADGNLQGARDRLAAFRRAWPEADPDLVLSVRAATVGERLADAGP